MYSIKSIEIFTIDYKYQNMYNEEEEEEEEEEEKFRIGKILTIN